MKEKEFREKLMKYRIATGKEPYFIYINPEDQAELFNEPYFSMYFTQAYNFKPNQDVKRGELIMKFAPTLVIETNGVITVDGHPVGNINYEPEWKEVPNISVRFRGEMI